ncbi:unnamed protein product, partial [Mesorhabditis spiculigera]
MRFILVLLLLATVAAGCINPDEYCPEAHPWRTERPHRNLKDTRYCSTSLDCRTDPDFPNGGGGNGGDAHLKDRHLLLGEDTDHEAAHLVGHPSRRYCSSPLDCKPGESCRKFKKVLAFNTGQCLPIQSPGK